ncbi:acid phosphatase [Thozetella sp. PMI_491]|nr:acid phosphatase [Thozetella sp. PMI_491]
MGPSTLVSALKSWVPGSAYKYSALPPGAPSSRHRRRPTTVWKPRSLPPLKFALAAMSLAIFLYLGVAFARGTCVTCDTPEDGYQCAPELSHSWGQYSPFFKVASDIDPGVPQGCKITFAQILSRHGARDPTASKTATYSKLVNGIHDRASSYAPGWEFIKDYNYTLGADQLSIFGQKQMIRSGIKFYQRYEALASKELPFIRSAGQDRVVESAQNWTQGFHQSLLADQAATAPKDFPYDMVIISEDAGVNNTLSHSLCTAFEDGPYSSIGDDAKGEWADIFTPALQARINENLPGANLSTKDVISFLDLCPFNTVVEGKVSRFCNLFTPDEWHEYDYYESLDKWYGIGPGNPLGSSQGVGWVNELLARLTGTPVVDHTTTNQTLDTSQATFPLNRTLYADFSHDNDMTGILAALGLYNGTAQLSKTEVQRPESNGGFSSSWVVPFAARIYVEKMSCPGAEEELVRILVNDRVVPPQGCSADALGRCTLSKFVASQSFARSGGLWDLCFV